MTDTSPKLELQEKRASACRSFDCRICHRLILAYITGVQSGAIFVNQSATEHFKLLLSSVGLEGAELNAHADEAVEPFETDGKKTFDGVHQNGISIKVGGFRFTEKSINVRRGIMDLSR